MGCNCNKKIKNTNLVRSPEVKIYDQKDDNTLKPPSIPEIKDEKSSLAKAWNEFKKTGSAVKNLIDISSKQPDPIKWFKDGISGLLKCADEKTIYSDKDILKNRDVCRNCPYSTKDAGNITLQSQCLGPDPENNNIPCGCFIVCKTQVGQCPLKKWTTTPLTISV